MKTIVIKIAHKDSKTGKKYYTEEKVKVIKEYEKFFLVERAAGYRQCIDKHELKLMGGTKEND